MKTRRNDTADSCAQLEPKSELSSDASQQFLDTAIEKQEKLAESGVEMAKLFLQNGKRQIAKRRLREIVGEFGGSAAANEALALLKNL